MFIVGLDFFLNIDKLQVSANWKILYMLYNFVFFSKFTFPLSLAFGLILTLSKMIKSNELVSLYSLGVSKKEFLGYILSVAFIAVALHSSLWFTKFANSQDLAYKILTNKLNVQASKSDIFLKYFDKYLYMDRLYPLQKRATNIQVIELKDGFLSKMITAKEGYFVDNKWKLINATVTIKPHLFDFQNGKLIITKVAIIETLEGFKPKILDSIYETSSIFTIQDALYSIFLLNKQKIDTSKIRASLYEMIFFPFYILFVMVIIFYYAPTLFRSGLATLFSSVSIFATIISWGFLYSITKLSNGNFINVEIAFFVPLFFLVSICIYFYKKL
jgi:lipopolysaccharide export system permease protein